MSEDKAYKDGDIVWVKLGNNWWPGEVIDAHRHPDGLVTNVKRKLYCIVKFFNENAYEYVSNVKQIYPFQCPKKAEFLKKGLSLYKSGNKFMEKFPEDVEVAERLTRNKVPSLFFNDRPDSIVKAILGQPLVLNSDDEYYGSSDYREKRKSGESITKIMNITPSKSTTAKQPPATPNIRLDGGINSAASSSSATKNNDNSSRTLFLGGDSSGRSSTSNSNSTATTTNTNNYQCNMCDFTSVRQNVMILHRKMHSSRNGSTNPRPNHNTSLIRSSIINTPPSNTKVNKPSSLVVKRSSAENTTSNISLFSETPAKIVNYTRTNEQSTSNCSTAHQSSITVASEMSSLSDFEITPEAEQETPCRRSMRHNTKTETLAVVALSSGSNVNGGSTLNIDLPESKPIKKIPKKRDFVNLMQLDDDEITPCGIEELQCEIETTSTETLTPAATTPAAKGDVEEIRKMLLEDWSDDDETADHENKTKADTRILNSSNDIVLLSPGPVLTSTPASSTNATATSANTGGRIRNIPKKDRRDVIIQDFSGEMSLIDTEKEQRLQEEVVLLGDSSNSSAVEVIEEHPAAPIITINDEIEEDENEINNKKTPPRNDNDKSIVASILSCFDFQASDDEEDNDGNTAAVATGSAGASSVAHFKKKYLSNEKTQTHKGVDTTITSQQRDEMAQKDQQLTDEIEKLLAVTQPPQTDLLTSTNSVEECISVKDLPIKERGKRIFKSRNRSRIEEKNTSSSVSVIDDSFSKDNSCNKLDNRLRKKPLMEKQTASSTDNRTKDRHRHSLKDVKKSSPQMSTEQVIEVLTTPETTAESSIEISSNITVEDAQIQDDCDLMEESTIVNSAEILNDAPSNEKPPEVCVDIIDSAMGNEGTLILTAEDSKSQKEPPCTTADTPASEEIKADDLQLADITSTITPPPLESQSSAEDVVILIDEHLADVVEIEVLENEADNEPTNLNNINESLKPSEEILAVNHDSDKEADNSSEEQHEAGEEVIEIAVKDVDIQNYENAEAAKVSEPQVNVVDSDMGKKDFVESTEPTAMPTVENLTTEEFTANRLITTTPPTDENSSMCASDTGAEFGSPTSMLSEERLPTFPFNRNETPHRDIETNANNEVSKEKVEPVHDSQAKVESSECEANANNNYKNSNISENFERKTNEKLSEQIRVECNEKSICVAKNQEKQCRNRETIRYKNVADGKLSAKLPAESIKTSVETTNASENKDNLCLAESQSQKTAQEKKEINLNLKTIESTENKILEISEELASNVVALAIENEKSEKLSNVTAEENKELVSGDLEDGNKDVVVKTSAQSSIDIKETKIKCTIASATIALQAEDTYDKKPNESKTVKSLKRDSDGDKGIEDPKESILCEGLKTESKNMTKTKKQQISDINSPGNKVALRHNKVEQDASETNVNAIATTPSTPPRKRSIEADLLTETKQKRPKSEESQEIKNDQCQNETDEKKALESRNKTSAVESVANNNDTIQNDGTLDDCIEIDREIIKAVEANAKTNNSRTIVMTEETTTPQPQTISAQAVAVESCRPAALSSLQETATAANDTSSLKPHTIVLQPDLIIECETVVPASTSPILEVEDKTQKPLTPQGNEIVVDNENFTLASDDIIVESETAPLENENDIIEYDPEAAETLDYETIETTETVPISIALSPLDTKDQLTIVQPSEQFSVIDNQTKDTTTKTTESYGNNKVTEDFLTGFDSLVNQRTETSTASTHDIEGDLLAVNIINNVIVPVNEDDSVVKDTCPITETMPVSGYQSFITDTTKVYQRQRPSPFREKIGIKRRKTICAELSDFGLWIGESPRKRQVIDFEDTLPICNSYKRTAARKMTMPDMSSFDYHSQFTSFKPRRRSSIEENAKTLWNSQRKMSTEEFIESHFPKTNELAAKQIGVDSKGNKYIVIKDITTQPLKTSSSSAARKQRSGSSDSLMIPRNGRTMKRKASQTKTTSNKNNTKATAATIMDRRLSLQTENLTQARISNYSGACMAIKPTVTREEVINSLNENQLTTAQQQLKQLQQQQQQIQSPSIMLSKQTNRSRKNNRTQLQQYSTSNPVVQLQQVQQQSTALQQQQQQLVTQLTTQQNSLQFVAPQVQQQVQPANEGFIITTATPTEDDNVIDSNTQLIALPTQPYPGYTETFLLCKVKGNTCKPVDNVPLYLNHQLNELVPIPLDVLENAPRLQTNDDGTIEIKQLSNTQTQLLVEEDKATAQISLAEVGEVVSADISSASDAENVLQQQFVQTATDATAADDEITADLGANNGILLNIEGQQVLLDAATFEHLLANPDANTQLISDDGTEYVLTHEVLQALHMQQQQEQQQQQQQIFDLANVSQHAATGLNNDIIAVAMAGSDLYGNGVLTIDTSHAVQLLEGNSAGVVFQQPPSALVQQHLTPPAVVTNAVLDQSPIMSTLEVPSGNRTQVPHCITVPSSLPNVSSSGAVTHTNIEDSLATIGVTTQASAMSSSLGLPITVTDPNIASKVTSAGPLNEILQFVSHRPATAAATAAAVAAAALAGESRIFND